MFDNLERREKGKIAEFHVISKLIASDLDLYVPVVDRGIDCVVRMEKPGKPASYYDLQIKSARYNNVSIRGSKKIIKYIDERKPENYFLVIAIRKNGEYKHIIYLTAEQIRGHVYRTKKEEVDINISAEQRDLLIKSQSLDTLIGTLKDTS